MVDESSNAEIVDENLPAVVEIAPTVIENKIKRISGGKRNLEVTDTGGMAVENNLETVQPSPSKSKRISGNKMKDVQTNLPVPKVADEDNTVINVGNNKAAAEAAASEAEEKKLEAARKLQEKLGKVQDKPVKDTENEESKRKAEQQRIQEKLTKGNKSNSKRATPNVSDILDASDKNFIDGEKEKNNLYTLAIRQTIDEKNSGIERPEKRESVKEALIDLDKMSENVKAQFLEGKLQNKEVQDLLSSINANKELIRQELPEYTRISPSKAPVIRKPSDEKTKSGNVKTEADFKDKVNDKIIDLTDYEVHELPDSLLSTLVEKAEEYNENDANGVENKGTVFTTEMRDKILKEIKDRDANKSYDSTEKTEAENSELDKELDKEENKGIVDKLKGLFSKVKSSVKKESEESVTEKTEEEKAKEKEEELTEIEKKSAIRKAFGEIAKRAKEKGISTTEFIEKYTGTVEGIIKKSQKEEKDKRSSSTIDTIKDVGKYFKDRSRAIGDNVYRSERDRTRHAEGSIAEAARQKHGLRGSLTGGSDRKRGAGSLITQNRGYSSSSHGSIHGHYSSRSGAFGSSSSGGIQTTHNKLGMTHTSFGSNYNTGRTPMVGKAGFGSLTASRGGKDASGSIAGTHTGARDAGGSIMGKYTSGGSIGGGRDASGSIQGVYQSRDAGGSIRGTGVTGVNYTKDAGGSIRQQNTKDAAGSVMGNNGKDASGTVIGGNGKDASGSIMGKKAQLITKATLIKVGDVIGTDEVGEPIYATEEDVQIATQNNKMVIVQKQGNALGIGYNSKTARPSGMLRGEANREGGNAIGVGNETKAGHPSQIMGGYKKKNMVTDRKKGSAVVGDQKEGNPVAGVGHTSGIMRGYKNKSSGVATSAKEGNPVATSEKGGHPSKMMRVHGKKDGNPVAVSEKGGHPSQIARGFGAKSGSPVSVSDNGENIIPTSEESGHPSQIARGFGSKSGNPVPSTDKGGHPSQMARGFGSKSGNPVASSEKGGHPSQIARGFSAKSGNPIPTSNKIGNPVHRGEKGGHPSKMMRGGGKGKPVFATQVGKNYPTVDAQTGQTINVGAANVIMSAKGRLPSATMSQKIDAVQANRAQFEVGERTGNPVRVLSESTRFTPDGSPAQMMKDKFSVPVAITADMGQSRSFEGVASKTLGLSTITIPNKRVPIITPVTTRATGETFKIHPINEPYIIPPKTAAAPPVAANSIVSRSAMLDPDSGVIPLALKNERIKAGLSFSRK
jgi:hypothetical protein